MNRYKDALQVQNACNLCGVAQAFAKMCKDVLEETKSTAAVAEDPAIMLFLDKMWDMIERPSFSTIHNVYDKCEELKNG